MRTLVLAAALVATAGFGAAVQAADGELLAGFGTDAEFPGYGFYVNPNGSINFTLDTTGDVVARPDGKFWLVGRMKGPNSSYRLSLYRIQNSGYPDVEFGDQGLRTVVGPCADFNVAEAALDSQGRLLVVVDGCADFMVYRFLPNGDLDFSLAGTGVLTVPFDRGGSNDDYSQEIAVTPDDGFVVAGPVATAGVNELGIARFSAEGQPAPGFGTDGQLTVAFEWSVPAIRGVNGLHLMADGRIVVAGAISETSQAVSDKKQFVVRMLGNGHLDPSFGNVSAGISKINLRTPLGLAQSPWTSYSLLERSGAIIQVGSMLSNNPNSHNNIFLLRWRPDGQLDTGIGAHGVREYALDFAGPNPPEAGDNSEMAHTIVRQGDGKYLILANSSLGESHATAVLRIKRDFTVDASFGDGGTVQHAAEIAVNGDQGQAAGPTLIQPGRIVVGGVAFTGINGRIQMMFAMQNDHLFGDTFD